jgi:CDP-diacylglycerol--serine O-phosphatidyltransferase
MINLLCGVMGIVGCFSGNIQLVPWLVAIALLADFLDGFAARALKVHSELGKQLDSLADCVTFGVLPGIIFLFLFSQKGGFGTLDLTKPNIGFISFLYPICAALRLGKFNIDTRQTVNFIGMPTPAGGLFATGVLLVFLNNTFGLTALTTNHLFLAITVPILSWLLLSPIPMFSLKANLKQWKGNEAKIVFFASCAILLATCGWLAFPLIITLYAGHFRSVLFDRQTDLIFFFGVK